MLFRTCIKSLFVRNIKLNYKNDMSLKAVSGKNLAIINHNRNNYRVNFAFISKKDAYNLIKNATIVDKKRNIISVIDTNKITFVSAYYKDEF